MSVCQTEVPTINRLGLNKLVVLSFSKPPFCIRWLSFFTDFPGLLETNADNKDFGQLQRGKENALIYMKLEPTLVASS